MGAMKLTALYPSDVSPASFLASIDSPDICNLLNRPDAASANQAADRVDCYFRVELEQRTRAWRDWRTQGLGASDAACVLDESPFKSAAALMDEKLASRVDDLDSSEIALGIALEPDARREYCQEIGADLEPVCVQSIRHPWLRASLDGMSADGQRVVEIKCGQGAYWRTAKTRRPPTYYIPQLQHILAITGLPSIDFVCYFPPLQTICLTIKRDDAYIAKLIRAEEEFWNRVEALRRCRNTRKAA
jgi:putative phage-type endonuclease